MCNRFLTKDGYLTLYSISILEFNLRGTNLPKWNQSAHRFYLSALKVPSFLASLSFPKSVPQLAITLITCSITEVRILIHDFETREITKLPNWMKNKRNATTQFFLNTRPSLFFLIFLTTECFLFKLLIYVDLFDGTRWFHTDQFYTATPARTTVCFPPGKRLFTKNETTRHELFRTPSESLLPMPRRIGGRRPSSRFSAGAPTPLDASSSRISTEFFAFFFRTLFLRLKKIAKVRSAFFLFDLRSCGSNKHVRFLRRHFSAAEIRTSLRRHHPLDWLRICIFMYLSNGFVLFSCQYYL